MNVEWVLSSCVLILLIVLIRFLLRKRLSPRVRYALWLIVALRLLLPVSFLQTAVSIQNVMPKQEVRREALPGVSSMETHSEQPEWRIDTASGEKSDSIENADAIETDNGGKTDNETIPDKVQIPESAVGMVSPREIQRLLYDCWLIGIGICAAIFLLVNLDYGRRLKRSRKRITDGSLPFLSDVAVYKADMVQTPCLFGLFHPAVYVTEKVMEEEKSFLFVLSHENMHYKHYDNWWAFLRIICVCLHWYNPFVWMAAYLSKQDAELACDEETLKNLGDEVRIEYGKTLLSLCAAKVSGMDRWRISTTMRGSKGQLRERLQMIVHVPKKSVGVYVFLFLIAPLVLAVTFTGRKMAVEAKQAEMTVAIEVSGEIKASNMPELSGAFPNGGEDSPAADASRDEWEYVSVQPQDDSGDALSYDGIFRSGKEDGSYAEVYCRYDENERLHMVRYVEENMSADAVFEKLDLTYIEDDGMYTMQATVDDDFHLTAVAMAKQALAELYQWTGEKVDTACFQVSNVGGVHFTVSVDDMEHSRVFLSRYFGVDTPYNISGYDRAISSIDIASGRSVWYSPVLWRYFPDAMEGMTDEEVIIWYVERFPPLNGDKVASIEKRYEDMWTIGTESGRWFEVVYDRTLREVYDVTGPYPGYPQH